MPFKEAFLQLKHVDLAELADIGELAAAGLPDVQLRRMRLDAVDAVDAVGAVTAVAGSAIAAAGAGAATYATVGAFATASTGAAISGLSGAAASSATLAWLGGGAVAAGGGGVAVGTAVLTGIVATPVVLTAVGLLEWKSRRLRRDQRENAAGVARASAELAVAEARASAVCERSRQIRHVLDRLRDELQLRLPGLRTMLEGGDDYAVYTPSQRGEVAVLVALASTATTVMSAPLADEDGQVTDVSRLVVEDALARLQSLMVAG
ncbi:hypothetical protein [Streptomyces spiramyceticus]|uniref:hypothetical protein n=1 Tax=Streptomyces spiramyceticus TaxID=299717 RepID=UPI00237AA5E3|nr:hypothetical protein [Streptomyces spiramyceticus]